MTTPVATGAFQVVVADPPWRFQDALPGSSRGAVRNYRVMDERDLRWFLPALEARGDVVIAPDAWLFMWRVSALVPQAYRVCEAWGFRDVTELVWQKLTARRLRWFGMGRYVRASHESCIVAVRGRVTPRTKNIRSTFEAVCEGHSRKPDEFYALVEQLSAGPYLELFARRHRPGWVCMGDQLPAREAA